MFSARLAIYGRMTQSDTIPFTKMNGLGNEIVIVDVRGSAKVFSAKEAAFIATDRSIPRFFWTLA